MKRIQSEQPKFRYLMNTTPVSSRGIQVNTVAVETTTAYDIPSPGTLGERTLTEEEQLLESLSPTHSNGASMLNELKNAAKMFGD